MDVCLRLFFVCVVLCAGSGLATGWSSVQGVLATVLGLRNWSAAKRFTDAVRSKVGSNRNKERERESQNEDEMLNTSRTLRRIYSLFRRVSPGYDFCHSVYNLSFFFTTSDWKVKLWLCLLSHVSKTWSVNLRKEKSLKKSENIVLTRIFGPEREEVTGWWKFHTKELYNLYFSQTLLGWCVDEVGRTCSRENCEMRTKS
jgi:hypothetical protein